MLEVQTVWRGAAKNGKKYYELTANTPSCLLFYFFQAGFDVHTCIADLSDESGRNLLFKKAESLFGESIDCLVNNVGTNIRKLSVEYEPPEFEKIMNTNLVSAFRLSQQFYPLLKKSGRGSVVNIGSVAGKPVIIIRQ